MICPHCKRALDEALEKIEKATEICFMTEEEARDMIEQSSEIETREPWNDSFDEEVG